MTETKPVEPAKPHVLATAKSAKYDDKTETVRIVLADDSVIEGPVKDHLNPLRLHAKHLTIEGLDEQK